jgi:hypothetical protein
LPLRFPASGLEFQRILNVLPKPGNPPLVARA